ncbi:hypothetical protein Tco_0847348 [Tanacetum coccineum]
MLPFRCVVLIFGGVTPLEIVGREVKRLKRSRIPLVKVRWNFKRGPEFTWEREDQFKKKYPHLFAKTAPSSSTPLSIGITKIKNDDDVDAFVNVGYQNKWVVNLYVVNNVYDELDIRYQGETDAVERVDVLGRKKSFKVNKVTTRSRAKTSEDASKSPQTTCKSSMKAGKSGEGCSKSPKHCIVMFLVIFKNQNVQKWDMKLMELTYT